MKKRILSILLLCCMVLTLLPTTAFAAETGAMDNIPAKFDVEIDLCNRTSDINIKDSKTYYIYSSSSDPDFVWTKKIQINGKKAAPHIFLDNVNIQVKKDAKTPAIELHGKASAYLYFINRDSKLTGATGRAAIQKNRSEGQLCVQVMRGTTVTCQGGYKAAGIGGSWATRNIAESLFNLDMYGHGANMHFGSQTNPSLWSGTIIAKGGDGGAGIGGGRNGSGEKLYFYSGKIEAKGGEMGAGIGGSFKGRGRDIYIYGGDISATGGTAGAGIGGGCWTSEQDMDGDTAAYNINIYGGKVYACGSYNGAGIGGGQYVPARDITITGGEVNAHGAYGAAIGGGRWCHGQNITVTDAKLKLTTGYNQFGSNAAAMGYGDLVYSSKVYSTVLRYIGDFVRNPLPEDYKSIKIGSYNGKLIKLKVEAQAINRNDDFTFFWNLYDILIPNENGRIDVQLLTLPYVKNYGWAINAMELELIDDPCNGNHDFGWVDRQSCHVWACRNMKCQARDPVAPESASNGKHASSGWNTEKHRLLCDVCGHVMETDTKAPVLEVLKDGEIYTAEDVRDEKTLEGKPGAYTFTVSDPAASGEASSGIKSVTINGEPQTGPTYRLPAPDGGNNDAGAKYTVVATDNAGNETTATVRTYRWHHVKVISPDGNGTASASPDKAVAGTEIRLTATPNTGYHFKEWQVMSGGVTIKDNKFLMPNDNVEVKAIFEEDAPPTSADPAKPSISVTGTYTYNGSEHTATVSGYDPATMDISGNTGTDAGDYTVRVTSNTGKWADGSTDAVTAAWSIGKATQEAPNGLIGVAPTTEGGSDGKITGTDDTMEYRAAGETVYTPCTGSEITGLSAGTYDVRYRASKNLKAGDDAKVLVGKSEPPQPTEFTVTFDANGGRGSMEPETVEEGTSYLLPECAFTAPEGKEFDAWKIDGARYDVGDPYLINANTTATALWKDIDNNPGQLYSITILTSEGGSITASHTSAEADTQIFLTVAPNSGYLLEQCKAIEPRDLIVGPIDTNVYMFYMPESNVVLQPVFVKYQTTEFIVIFDGNGGTPSVGSMTTTNQKLPSLPSASRSGSYSFDGWYTEKSGGTKITTDTVFSAKTTVYAHWTYIGGGGGGYNPPVTYYTLRFETGGGSDIPSVREAYNTYIDLTKYVPTWRGHTFIGWYSERSLTNKVSGVYLTKDMTVYAGWRVDENPGTGVNPFTDVSEKDWFYGDVMFVYENGLMLGTSKTLFSPHGTATRGMMATILWRMEGSPVPKGKNSFTDVEAGKWYADAITWTAENGIFAGYGKDKFGPGDPITREQLAAIFYRYADYKGYDLTVKGDLDKFKDADKITDYAKTAMQWAVGSGLMKGKSGNLLDPQGTATRAEIAAMLHRFIEKYELVQGKAPGGLMGWIDPKRLQIPKTGDSSVLGLWGFSLCTSLAGCLALTTWQIRRRREEEALQIVEK